MTEKDVKNQADASEMLNENTVPGENAELPPEAGIVKVLNEEHAYLSRLILVVKEQLSAFEIGKDPHYSLMHDIVSFVGEFKHKYKYKAKDHLIQTIIDQDPEANAALEELRAEKPQLASLRESVLASLKSLLKEDTILKREQLRIFTADYVEMLEAHIENESDILPRAIRSTLTLDQIEKFDREYAQSVEDEGFAAHIEDSYKHLYDRLSKQIEEAASEFAMTDFASMRRFVESVEPFGSGAQRMSKIIKDYSYKLFLANYECYKELMLENQQNKLDYINKPVDCFKNCVVDYKEGLNELGDAMRETKDRVVEPISTSKFFRQTDNEEGSEAAKSDSIS
ncbi:Uncharacterised protein [BD1-7 clade bacterium]|uniref:Hemerythrin-like domain-containing protein n=1 Tax=BD1-7 clade bacterium TaxID=2029982 RepID=A0A5S9QLX1_9GAMM|nr:Uncharacterised protein [BD1-7 clade bacterium]